MAVYVSFNSSPPTVLYYEGLLRLVDKTWQRRAGRHCMAWAEGVRQDWYIGVHGNHNQYDHMRWIFKEAVGHVIRATNTKGVALHSWMAKAKGVLLGQIFKPRRVDYTGRHQAQPRRAG